MFVQEGKMGRKYRKRKPLKLDLVQKKKSIRLKSQRLMKRRNGAE